VGSSIRSSELQALLQLTALTKMGIAGIGWDDDAADAALANMTGEACLGECSTGLLA
jgi:hypothetical protein